MKNKIAIISDVHNNEVNLKKVLDYCKESEIKKIICCGDLASLETLDFLNDNFSGEIYFTFGNMDNDQLCEINGHPMSRDLNDRKTLAVLEYKNTKIFKEFGEIEIENKRIAFVHYPKSAKRLAETGKYDFVFYGHTHQPWVSSVPLSGTTANQGRKMCTMLNPGNVAGEIYPPTFAIWNTGDDKFDLLRIHDLK